MPNSFADRPVDPRAEVRAHDRVMRYRRLGAGPPLLLLGSVDGLDRLAERFRLIVPELPAVEPDLAAWLAAFLEGLGSVGVAVVAADEHRAVALELERLDPDRVQSVLQPADLTRFLGGS